MIGVGIEAVDGVGCTSCRYALRSADDSYIDFIENE
jgi:hypothetical protein